VGAVLGRFAVHLAIASSSVARAGLIAPATLLPPAVSESQGHRFRVRLNAIDQLNDPRNLWRVDQYCSIWHWAHFTVEMRASTATADTGFRFQDGLVVRYSLVVWERSRIGRSPKRRQLLANRWSNGYGPV
jgi:hypothetical protein